jgi:hypothetical protein
MTLFTETKFRQTLQTAFLKWFAAEEISFEQETAAPNCAANQASASTNSPNPQIFGLLDIGTVMGRIIIGGGTPAAAVANGGNTGNGTVGTVTAQTGEQVGTYTVSFTAATAFNVYDPKGALVGSGATGTAFANQLGFTITAGGTAFAVGDSFTIAVQPGSSNVTPLNPSAVDGSAVAMGIVVRPQTVPAAATAAVVLAERLVVGLLDYLIWPAGITSTQQAAALAQLAANYVICRPS